MANEFICFNCKGDGTRCDCHKSRKNYYVSLYERRETQEEAFERSNRELDMMKWRIRNTLMFGIKK